MREWLEVVTLMEYHEVDRDTCSACSAVVDVGDCWCHGHKGRQHSRVLIIAHGVP